MKNIIKTSLISIATCAVLFSLQGCGKDRAGVSVDDPRVPGSYNVNGVPGNNRNVTPEDSDGDGIPDNVEKQQYTNECDQKVNTDWKKWDSDGDGLSDGYEKKSYSSYSGNSTGGKKCTNPQKDDTDNDGIKDANEVIGYNVPGIGTRKTDPTDDDTDNDGIKDGNEKNSYQIPGIGTRYSDPKNPDTDGDMLSDGNEKELSKTDPRDKDSDNDGVTDGIEVCGTSNFATTRSNGEIISTNADISTDRSNNFNDDLLTSLVNHYDPSNANKNKCKTPADYNNDGVIDALDNSNDSDGDGRPNNKEYSHNHKTDPLNSGTSFNDTNLTTGAQNDINNKYYYPWITQKEPGKTLITKGFVYIPKDSTHDGYWMAKYEARYLNDDNTKNTVVFNYPDANNLVGNKITVSFNDTQTLVGNTSPISINNGTTKAIRLPYLYEYQQIKNNKGNTVTKTVNGNNINCLEVKNKFNDDEVSSSYTGVVCELSTNYEYLSDGSKHDSDPNNLGSTVNNNNDTAFRASASK